MANFLKYADAKFYDGGRFHRTVTPANQPNNKVKIEVIQGGPNPASWREWGIALSGRCPSSRQKAANSSLYSMPMVGQWPRRCYAAHKR